LPNRTFIFGVTVLAVIIIVAGASWTLVNSNQSSVQPSENSQSSQNSQTTPNATNSTETQNSEASNETYPESTGTNSSEIVPLENYAPPEDVRDAAVTYIKTAHPRIAPYLNETSWTGGRLDTSQEGTESYIYYVTSWTVTVDWQLVSNPVYKISANYSSTDTYISWIGTYQNGNIKQTSLYPSSLS
jgi:hypothetical protein